MGGVRNQQQVEVDKVSATISCAGCKLQVSSQVFLQPFLEQMKQELDQIAPTISNNPFMKNDMRKKTPFRKEINTEATEFNNNDNQDLSFVDELQAIQKDDLKRELCSVLKEIRKEEDDLTEKVRYIKRFKLQGIGLRNMDSNQLEFLELHLVS